jgi:hypothetical protein
MWEYWLATISVTSFNCNSPAQPQHELEFDLIMGRNPPHHHSVNLVYGHHNGDGVYFVGVMVTLSLYALNIMVKYIILIILTYHRCSNNPIMITGSS